MNNKIILVEDNDYLSENISETLELHDYTVLAVLNNAETAKKTIQEKKPDLVLIDIKLKGVRSGIQLAEELREGENIPLVFITSSSGKEIIKRVQHLNPDGFITKPFTLEALVTTIELAICNHKFRQNLQLENTIHLSNSEIFIRENGWLVKILVKDIDWIKTEGTYSQLKVNNKQYTLRNTAKEIMDKLPEQLFVRIQKSYIINVNKIEAINSTFVKVQDFEIPIGRNYYQDLLKRINKISN